MWKWIRSKLFKAVVKVLYDRYSRKIMTRQDLEEKKHTDACECTIVHTVGKHAKIKTSRGDEYWVPMPDDPFTWEE